MTVLLLLMARIAHIPRLGLRDGAPRVSCPFSAYCIAAVRCASAGPMAASTSGRVGETLAKPEGSSDLEAEYGKLSPRQRRLARQQRWVHGLWCLGCGAHTQAHGTCSMLRMGSARPLAFLHSALPAVTTLINICMQEVGAATARTSTAHQAKQRAPLKRCTSSGLRACTPCRAGAARCCAPGASHLTQRRCGQARSHSALWDHATQ